MGSGCIVLWGGCCQPFDVRKVFSLIREAAERLADTVIENKDFEALIRQYDREGAFFYCDPPYYMTEDYYEVSFPEQDHIRLKTRWQDVRESGWSAITTAAISGICTQGII